MLAVSLLAACGQRSAQRCAHCGMIVRAESRWRAGATHEGRAVVFDAPRCMFQFRLSAPSHALSDPWVIEYYGPGERRTPARDVRYVIGSRQRGPMGDDLVPVDPAAVARFRADHGGRAEIAYDEVTARTIESL